MTYEGTSNSARPALSRLALLAAFVFTIGLGTSEASNITFNDLVGANATPLTSYNEAGFTVAALTGSWFEAHLFGNPIPDIFSNSATGIVGVTRQGGGSFTFLGVDLGNGSIFGTESYLIEGLLSNAVVFTQSGTLSAGLFDTITSITNSNIDLLRITFNKLDGSSYNIDNIGVNAPANVVPEPGTILLLGTGLAGTIMRRRLRGNRA